MKKKTAITIVVVAIVALVGWLAWLRHVHTRDKLAIEVDHLASILEVFIDDYGRMPNDMEEMLSKRYLERESSGYLVSGPSYRGRGAGGEGILFQYLDKIRVGFGAADSSRPPLYVPDDEGVNWFAQHASGILLWKLDEAREKRAGATTASRPCE